MTQFHIRPSWDLLVKCYLGPDVPAGKRPNGGWNINGPKVAKILDE